MIDEDTLYLDLGGIITAVKQRLTDAGLTLVERLPDFTITVPLVASGEIHKLQRWTRLLNAAAWVLPLVALALLAGAVAAAPNRRRALLIGAAGFGIGMLVRAGGRLLDQAATGLYRVGPPLGRVPALVAEHRRATEAVLVVMALGLLVIWRHPGVAGTLWLTAGLAAAVCLVELLARLDQPAPRREVASG